MACGLLPRKSPKSAYKENSFLLLNERFLCLSKKSQGDFLASTLIKPVLISVSLENNKSQTIAGVGSYTNSK